jgi:hypothetical protein
LLAVSEKERADSTSKYDVLHIKHRALILHDEGQ